MKPEIRLLYERVADEKGHSKPHRHKKRRPLVHKKDHRVRPKQKPKNGLEAIWPGKAGPGLKFAFKAANALGIDCKKSKTVGTTVALGKVISALFSAPPSSTTAKTKHEEKPSHRIYDKRPTRKRELSSRNREDPSSSSWSSSSDDTRSAGTGSSRSSRSARRESSSSGKLTREKEKVITRGDEIFPRYQEVLLDSSDKEYSEYMIDSWTRKERQIRKGYVKSTVLKHLDEIERNVLETKMDNIDNAILRMDDDAFSKSKIKWQLKYAHVAAVAIQLGVEALLQECPGHFLDEKGKKIRDHPTDWQCEYDHDIRGRRKKPLQAIKDLTYRKTTDKNCVSGALSQYEWFFNHNDNQDHQLRYVSSDWRWYLGMSRDLRDMLSSVRPVYKELSSISDRYQLTKTEKKLLNKTVRLIWQTWTWARYLVCEHWRYIEIDEKSGAVYDERIEMVGDLSVLKDSQFKRAKQKYRDKQIESKREQSYMRTGRAQSVGRSRSRSRSQSKSSRHR